MQVVVHAGEGALDDDPRPQRQGGQAGQRHGVERQRALDGRRQDRAAPGPQPDLTDSVTWLTMARAVTPSASAWKLGTTRWISTGRASALTSSSPTA